MYKTNIVAVEVNIPYPGLTGLHPSLISFHPTFDIWDRLLQGIICDTIVSALCDCLNTEKMTG